MNQDLSHAIYQDIASALTLACDARIHFVREDRLPSCFPVTDLAAASIGAACAAVSTLAREAGADGRIAVDRRAASLWFGFSLAPQGWSLPSIWDAIAGEYRTQDGWIRLHTNAPHHKRAALSVLACAPTRAAVTAAAANWRGDELEAAIVAAGGCAALLRSRAEWLTHSQGAAVARAPLVYRDATTHASSMWRPRAERPLAGLRVLDMTRVLAGPVCTRFLAGFGAEVLRIDPPDWEEPAVIPEVTLGKRCARLDLKTPDGRATFEKLLAQADIFVHGYRADALEALGFGADARQALRPGLIDVSLNAYGHEGPWRLRRGFDSLVQLSCGIAAQGMEWRQSTAPVPLPVQALDHATGYLMACAVARGVLARLRGEGDLRFRLSLARTAELLFAHPCAPDEAPFPPARAADLSPAIEATAWGPALRVRPPASIDGAPIRWENAACALGSSTPEWA